MKRRGFMGLLCGGLVSAPSMAKAAVAQAAIGLEGMAIPGMLSAGVPTNNYRDYPTEAGSAKGVEYDHGQWLTDRVKDLAGLSEDAIRERRERTWVDRLDPDLAVNRSYSLSAKINIQRSRNFTSQLEGERRQARRDLADWLKRQL